jgi:ribosomal protein S18 acetylase RimI-like enzyme
MVFVYHQESSILGYISIRLVQGCSPKLRRSLRAWRKLFGSGNRHSVLVFKPRRYGFIEDWYVLAEFRNRGIGMQLLRAGIEWFKQKQVSEIDTTVWVNNEQSLRLFRKLNFQKVRLMLRKRLTGEGSAGQFDFDANKE